ncbi:DUF6011 domain-containing protein [Streptosporangium sp. OZ121]|uniref:DUF6011 domain-containing protein n=1 Tax=Streptosporangium sp. OZ121 TaxID=3444183 RepID=UPI003F7AB348
MRTATAPARNPYASTKQIDLIRSLASDREPIEGWELVKPLVDSGKVPPGVARLAIDRFFKSPYRTTAKLEAGFYSLHEYIYEVRISEAGRAYALEIFLNEVGKVCREIARGVVRDLRPEHALTIEEAMAFGRETGSCCICGRVLTNPESIEKGIGPICEQRF